MVHDVTPERTTHAVVDAPSLLEHLPDGVAVVDERGVLLYCNPAGALICGYGEGMVVGRPSPFPAVGDEDVVLPDADHVVGWEPVPGMRRELAYRSAPHGAGERIVSFRDVSQDRLAQRRVEAIANAASRVAAEHSLNATLSSLAAEIQETHGIVAVQILTVSASGRRLHVLGAAGFARAENFFDQLDECRRSGAELRMWEALVTRAPAVLPHRYAQVMADPAWAPLHEHLRYPEWDGFISVPLLARGEPVGVLNAFFAPGLEVGAMTTDFLLSMAEQAARAVDHASLMEGERDVARQAERQHLARELHDSVVQTVFSMRMQTQSLTVLAERAGADDLQRVARELGNNAESVLTDLRSMVAELRPAPGAARGLRSSLLALAESVNRRGGMTVRVLVDDPQDELSELQSGLPEDVYRIASEAVHNCLKHSGAELVTVHATVEVTGVQRNLRLGVVDDGRGLPETLPEQAAGHGLGVETMRERAAVWGGEVSFHSRPGLGTTVSLRVPLALAFPAAPGGKWTARC
jgi:signal transduction histidine kinase